MGRWPALRWWVADAGPACMLEPVLEPVFVAVARTVVARTVVARTVVARTVVARTAVARTAVARTAVARTAVARTVVARTADRGIRQACAGDCTG